MPNLSYRHRLDCLRNLLALVTICVLMSGQASSAQAQGSDLSSPPASNAGAWRLIPQAALPGRTNADDVATLKNRGDYFDSVPGDSLIWKDQTRVPLDQRQPSRRGGAAHCQGIQEELPFFPKGRRDREVIVSASFNRYQTYLTPSHLSIYTDVELSVEQVLEPGASGVRAGTNIDVLLDGGMLLLANGRQVSSHLYSEDLEYSLRPGHRYILFLDYEQKGNFFIDYKDWEFVAGVAQPNRMNELRRLQEGEAKYSGLPEDAFVEAVRQAITVNKESE